MVLDRFIQIRLRDLELENTKLGPNNNNELELAYSIDFRLNERNYFSVLWILILLGYQQFVISKKNPIPKFRQIGRVVSEMTPKLNFYVFYASCFGLSVTTIFIKPTSFFNKFKTDEMTSQLIFRFISIFIFCLFDLNCLLDKNICVFFIRHFIYPHKFSILNPYNLQGG